MSLCNYPHCQKRRTNTDDVIMTAYAPTCLLTAALLSTSATVSTELKDIRGSCLQRLSILCQKSVFINKSLFTLLKSKAAQFTNLIPLRFPLWLQS